MHATATRLLNLCQELNNATGDGDERGQNIAAIRMSSTVETLAELGMLNVVDKAIDLAETFQFSYSDDKENAIQFLTNLKTPQKHRHPYF